MVVENLGKLEKIVSYACMAAIMIPSACALYMILRSCYEDYQKSRKQDEKTACKNQINYVKKV